MDRVATPKTGRVEMRGVSKQYLGTVALKDCTITLEPGTVTALAGENGAGKSTFIKLLSGVTVPTSGEIRLDGQTLRPVPHEVIDSGISVIYQELTDVPDMTVADNIVLGRQPSTLGWASARTTQRIAKEAMQQVGLGSINLNTPIRQLSLAQRQLVEVARCLARNAKVLVFDEPTSSLSESDVNALIEIIIRLQRHGKTILYVSHHLDELFRIADQVAVLRDGELVDSGDVGEWSEDTLVRTMLAKAPEQTFTFGGHSLGPIRLQANNVSAPRVYGADIHVREREVVGLVGLAGAGRTELLKAIAGFIHRTGTVQVNGVTVAPNKPSAASTNGIVYVPEDRKTEGLIQESSIKDNISLGNYTVISRGGLIVKKRQNTLVDDGMAKFQVKSRDRNQPVVLLSGGNQQKIVLARAAAKDPKIVLLDDPTRGVDVGAKGAIHRHITQMAEAGSAIIITSSDTDEVLSASNRVYVLRNGKIVSEVHRSDYDREKILQLATSG